MLADSFFLSCFFMVNFLLLAKFGFLPPASEGWRKVMFWDVSVYLSACPHPPNRLRSGLYASCLHAGLSCSEFVFWVSQFCAVSWLEWWSTGYAEYSNVVFTGMDVRTSLDLLLLFSHGCIRNVVVGFVLSVCVPVRLLVCPLRK